MPPDFAQPVEVRGRDLVAVLNEAQAQGYHAHRMTVLPETLYELRFWKLPADQAAVAQATKPPDAAALGKSKESFSRPNTKSAHATPESMDATKIH